ncbi:hypothetical protein PIIN_03329 [Serendipita indica DSM 11827]|uniref:Large ribosomal subunit protein bL32m n=1 Tax=Serendipita indica (strain DSM 11827) TaxID=1109443 RepID=G4TDN6_SERID|nr:hypothetical protein PIIN_03329 [Serendipita indica DSM 11827]
MASLILHPSRVAVPSRISVFFSRTLPFVGFAAPWTALRPQLESILELLPPWLLAVPKKKVSHSRKAMRSANKGLKDKQNIHACDACGRAKLMHNLCHHCFSEIRRAWKGPTAEPTPNERFWNA